MKKAFLSLVAYAICYFLLQPFSGPDAPQGALKFFGIALLACLSALSLVGWGVFWQRRFFSEISFCFAPAFGALAMGLLLLVLGMLGLIGAKFFWIFVPLQVAGLFFSAPLFVHGKLKQEASLLVLLPLIFLLLLALLPQDHPDPLFYHVLAPRAWFQEGGIQLLTHEPLLFLSGIWDMLYLWPIAWLPLKAGQELIAQLIASQVLHLLLGFGGAAALLWRWSARFSFPQRIVFLSISLASTWLLPVSFVAKNDWGLVLFFLTALGLLEQKQKRTELAAGIFFGAALLIKLSALPVFFCFALVYWRRLKSLPLVLGFFLGASPILLRNLLYTGSPVFPIGAEAVLSHSDQLLFQAYSEAWRNFSIHVLAERLSQLALGLPAALILLALPWLWRRISGEEKNFLLKNALAIFAATALGIVLLHPSLSWRVDAPLPLLWSLFCAWVFCLVLEWLLPYYTNFAMGLGSALLLWTLLPDLPQLQRFFEQPAILAREFHAGDAMAFVRLQETKEKIAVGGNPQLLFLSQLPAHTVETDPALDRLSWGAKLPSEFALALEAQGYRWFVETAGAIPWGRSSGLIAKLAERFPETVAFQGARGRVVDLQKLSLAIRANPFNEVPYGSQELRFDRQK